ncbi:MAG: rod shape-determining protein MreD [Terracoccus sp.]
MRVTLLGLGRTVYVIVAALLSATFLPRLGVPADRVPDLVLIGVAASAVLRGPVHGALLGLAAGWVVELVPPVGDPIGLTPLVLMAGGLLAGSFRRTSSNSFLRALGALAAASVVVIAGRWAAAIVAEDGFAPTEGLGQLVATVVTALIVLPLLLAADGALVRRRLG